MEFFRIKIKIFSNNIKGKTDAGRKTYRIYVTFTCIFQKTYVFYII
jgi:hypothetical protein